ncbi:MAG: hypothetical protein SF187_28685 [Deltaproteobacteria bacterium]|nr:hypothetical protein [Deltaproteobacteria bacterium]
MSKVSTRRQWGGGFGFSGTLAATWPPWIRRRVHTIVLAAAFACGALVPRDVLACSALQYWITGRFAGSTLDIEVYYQGGTGSVHMRNQGPDGGGPFDANFAPVMPTNLALRTSEGVNVPVRYEYYADQRPTFFIYTLIPASLAPNTAYEITDLIASVPCGNGSIDPCRWGDPVVIGTFTTSAVADERPPTKPGKPTVKFADDKCDNDSCCGPYAARIASVSWPSSIDPDTGKPVAHVLSKDNKVIAQKLGDSIALNVCGRSPFALNVSPSDFTARATGTYTIRAIDRTGALSTESSSFEIPSDICEDFAASDRGCSYGGHGNSSRPSCAILLLATFLFVRRRPV